MFAGNRLKREQAKADFVERARVPASEWPAGTRWCSGCQCFVPLFYTSGSRCKACASRARYAAHVESTYEITEGERQRLYAWQGGRCYICGQQSHGRRLAVDHDHRTGVVRGLLCANDEWGCNVSLRRLLDSPEMAARALSYVQKSPLARMRAGEPSEASPAPQGTLDLIRSAG